MYVHEFVTAVLISFNTDCSLFLRVSYQIQKQEQSRIIWINVKTLLPIQYKEHENLFYAEFTQTSFHPSTPIDDDSTSKSRATPQTDDPDDGVSFI